MSPILRKCKIHIEFVLYYAAYFISSGLEIQDTEQYCVINISTVENNFLNEIELSA